MKNKFEVRGEVTAIIINSPKHGRKEVLISTSQLVRVNEFVGSWYVAWDKGSETFYIRGNMPKENGIREGVKLHRWITNAPKGMQVDHFDHDGTNNTDGNLRVATYAENQQNKKRANKTSKSGIRGVSLGRREKKWRVRIQIGGVTVYTDTFESIHEAEKAAIKERAKHMPYSQEALQ
jgi:hypothetical protein